MTSPKNERKWVFIKYGCVRYHWKAHGNEISKSHTPILPHSNIGLWPWHDQKWVLNKYSRVIHWKPMERFQKNIFWPTSPTSCPTQKLVPGPKNKLKTGVHLIASCTSNTEGWSWAQCMSRLLLYQPVINLLTLILDHHLQPLTR